MAQKNRNIQGYEEMHSIQLADSEVILAENPAAELRYMVCDCTWDNPIGMDMYSNAKGSADFLEAMKLFTQRLSDRVIMLETERETRDIPFQVLTADDCQPIGDVNLDKRVVVIKPESLAPEYRSIDYQLALCTGGFGANPSSRGRTVYCKNLITGETSAWGRGDIAGTMPEERLPVWALNNLEVLRKPDEKETAVDTAQLGKEQFWQMIDTAREKAGHWRDMLDPLVEELSQLEEPDIIRFKQIFDEYSDHANKQKLYAAAVIINNGCSDDGFYYFRAWLIAQGKEVYLNALADPDSLADIETVKALAQEIKDSDDIMPPDGYRNGADFEKMIYSAAYAYEKKLGKKADIYKVIDNPLLSLDEKLDIMAEITYAEDIDQKWGRGVSIDEAEDAMKQMCPRLYKAFREYAVREADIEGPAEKESVLEKIKQDRQGKQAEKPPKQKKTDKSKKTGQEL